MIPFQEIYRSAFPAKERKSLDPTLRAAAAAFLLVVLTAAGISTQSTGGVSEGRKALLTGTWLKHGLAYRFDDDGTVTVMNLGLPTAQLRSPFTWLAMGSHTCIAFRKNPADSLSLEVVLVGDVTDSTAVLALGCPFVRANGKGGLVGTWNHVERVARIEWTFGLETVDYRKFILNLDTGREILSEELTGRWRRAERNLEPGVLAVEFEDGRRAAVLPVVHRDLMYLFDLSPGKSLFVRDANAPRGDTRLSAQPAPGPRRP